jgi:threonine-phosphate decarboxylase
MRGGEEHGGDWPRLVAAGWDPDRILDLSASVNRYGPGPAVESAWPALVRTLGRYPDRAAGQLRDALARHLAVPPAAVLPVAGATAALDLLVAGHPGWPVFAPPPGFGEYAGAARRGRSAFTWTDAPPDRPGIAFLANPQSPTGTLLPGATLDAWREWARRTGGVLAVDESFLEFLPDWASRTLATEAATGALYVVGSLTKFYGLAALRVGYVVGRPDRVAALAELVPPWSLGGVAEAAAVAALGDQAFFAETRMRIRADWQALRAALADRGGTFWPDAVPLNFLLVRLPDPPAAVAGQLARRGILVRTTDSFFGPASPWIRIAVPRPDELGRLTDALDHPS